MTGKERLWKRIRLPLESIVLIAELISMILWAIFGEPFKELVLLLCLIYFLLFSMRMIDERYEQTIEVYETRKKLIRAKWMINEIKDMAYDRNSRKDIVDFIEQFSKDFEI